ncbi:MAG: FAD-dependent oxidoreductase [Lautropia sp.]
MARKVEIVGAGPVGLAIAVALGRSGWSVRVHEASARLRPSGGGLYMQDRGVAALEAIGLGEDFSRTAWRPTFFETRLDGERSTYEVNQTLFHTMLRQDLHDLLLRGAARHGVEVVTGSRIALVRADGSIVAESGQQFAADLVIAADGVGSRAYENLGIPQSRERFSEGLIRVLANRRPLAGPQWEGTIDFWAYRHRPLRVLYTPCSADACYLAFMAPLEDTEAVAMPLNKDLWASSFPDLAPLLALLEDPGRFDRYGMIVLDRWSCGRVAIVGDAAHAMPSSLGQGANVGIGTAVSLASYLSNLDDIDAALRQWEREQRPGVEAVQNEAVHLIHSRALDRGRPEKEPLFVPGLEMQRV